jgi:GT2 family glycosyltransferase
VSEKVSIIILNYNGKQYLKDCLNSVLDQSYGELEIILFDNNSTDGSIEFVKEHFSDPRIKLINNKVNSGFAGGNNEALKHCSSDLVVLLNNDTIVEKDWLVNLVLAMEEKNTVASSFVITEGVPKEYYKTNGSVSYLMYNIMNIFPDIMDEFYPNGCSLIFRKSETGTPFDADYFFYGEDTYLGLKARFMGKKIKFVKNSIVHHSGGGTNTTSTFRTFCQERNRLLNLYTFFSLGFIIKILPYIILNTISKLFISVFSVKLSFWGLLKANAWFIVNISKILKKRQEIIAVKKVQQKDIIKYISSKVLNGKSFLPASINTLSYLYSRLVGIKPVEYYLKKGLPLK